MADIRSVTKTPWYHTGTVEVGELPDPGRVPLSNDRNTKLTFYEELRQRRET